MPMNPGKKDIEIKKLASRKILILSEDKIK